VISIDSKARGIGSAAIAARNVNDLFFAVRPAVAVELLSLLISLFLRLELKLEQPLVDDSNFRFADLPGNGNRPLGRKCALFGFEHPHRPEDGEKEHHPENDRSRHRAAGGQAFGLLQHGLLADAVVCGVGAHGCR
jgi:hypothetical protein